MHAPLIAINSRIQYRPSVHERRQTHSGGQQGEVEEDSTAVLLHWQCKQLLDGGQWRKGLVDGNAQVCRAQNQLLLNIVSLAVT